MGKKNKKKRKDKSMFRDTAKDGFGLLLNKEAQSVKASARLILAPKVYEQMMMFAALTDLEISGFALVERVDAITFRVDENLIVPKQVNTSGNTKMDNDDLTAITMQMIAEGKDISKMRLWWHSHNSMATFWSATDNTCCDAFDNGEYLISVVVNHKRDLRARIDIYKPLRIVLDCVDVVIDTVSQTERNEMIEHCKQIMTQKTSTHVYQNYDWRKDKERCAKCDYLKEFCKCEAPDRMALAPIDNDAEAQAAHMAALAADDEGCSFLGNQIPKDFEMFVFDMVTVGYDIESPTDVNNAIEEYHTMFSYQAKTTAHRVDIFGITWMYSGIEQLYEPMKKGWTMKDHEYLQHAYGEYLMMIKPKKEKVNDQLSFSE